MEQDQQLFIMTLKFQQQILQLTEYIRKLLLQGADISALYIIQARLTMLTSFLSPRTLLSNLFRAQDLAHLLSLTSNYFSSFDKAAKIKAESLRYSGSSMMEFEGVSLEKSRQDPLKDLSIQCEQILQSLEEWKMIASKTQFFHQKLINRSDFNTQIQNEQALTFQLQRQLSLLALTSAKKAITLNYDLSTECQSSPPESEPFSACPTPTKPRRIQVHEITSLFQYVIMWSNQINKQIGDYKKVIETTKGFDESSIDFENELRSSCFLGTKSNTTKYSKKCMQMNIELSEAPVDRFSSTAQRKTLKSQIQITRTPPRPKKEKQVEKVREFCPQCSIY